MIITLNRLKINIYCNFLKIMLTNRFKRYIVDLQSTRKGDKNLTNTELLERVIAESGLKKRWLANKMGLSEYGLSLKIQGINEFKTSEVSQLCELLGIQNLTQKEDIFFAKLVD